MALHPQARRAVAAVAFGALLLAAAATAGGYHLDDDVYRYGLATVSYDDGDLTVRDADTGTELNGVDPSPRIACEADGDDRRCLFERYLRDENATVTGPPSPAADYRYVLLDRFYRVGSEEAGDGWRLALTPVPAPEALSRSAVPVRRSAPAVKRAVESGSVVTYRRIPPERQFVSAGGEYYALYLTGFRDYGADAAWTGARCVERGADFCGGAALRRTGTSVLTVGALVGGSLAVAYGVREWLYHPVGG